MSPENIEVGFFFSSPFFLGAKLKLLDKLHNTSYIRQQIDLLFVNFMSIVEVLQKLSLPAVGATEIKCRNA